jgi:hypothetical protein
VRPEGTGEAGAGAGEAGPNRAGPNRGRGRGDRTAVDQGVTVRRGQGYTLRVTAVAAVHHQLLARCQPLDSGQGAPAVPAQRKARREYENRVSTLAPTGP